MIKLINKHKKVRGVITVFFTLIYLSVYLLMGIFVDGGRVRMGRAIIEDVQQIATENVMSQYNRGLYEYYGLFGVTDYYPEDIVADVKAQIEESIGLKVQDDVVKNFIRDIWVGGNSLKDNINLVTDNDNAYEGILELNSTVNQDLLKETKKFDPYGIKIQNVEAKYIDLTNVDAIRAQMRDEMRYTAIPVLLSNFFDVVEEFMSVGGVAEAISHIAETIEKIEKNKKEKLSDYYNTLNVFSTSFHELIKNSYGVNEISLPWGKVQIDKEITNVVDFVSIIFGVEAFNKIGSWILNKIRGNNNTNQTVGEKIYNIATDMHFGSNNGVDNTIENKQNELYRYCKEFDKSEGWPHGSTFKVRIQVGYKINGEPDYEWVYNDESKANHEAAVRIEANNRKNNYLNKVNSIKNDANVAIDNLNKSLDALDNTLLVIEEAEGAFCEGAKNKASGDKSKETYESYMETYLRQWNNLKNQKRVLLNFKSKLEIIKNLLDQADNKVNMAYNSIINENVSEDWNHPEDIDSFILNHRTEDIDNIQSTYLELCIKDGGVKVLKSFQDNADANKLSNDIISVITTMYTKNENEKDNVVEENSRALFGKILAHEKSDNEIYNPEDVALDDLNEDNIVTKIKNIMNKAMDIVTSIPEGFKDNVFDETYILTHCRDYVHTYRYSKLSDTQKNHEDIDSILNPKFIKDQSTTKYLTDAQFKDIQVTPAEIEYILFGNENTEINVAIMYANIFVIRLALNYIAALTSPCSSAEIDALAAASLVFAPVVKFAAPLIYALPQSIYETKQIMIDCRKVKVWNGGKDLHLWSSVENIMEDFTQKAKEAVDKIKSNAKKAIDNMDQISLVAATQANEPLPPNIVEVLNYLSSKSIPIDIFDSSDIDNPTESRFTELETVSNIKKVEIKAGYTDYLLVYLFIRGIGPLKNSQISNLQDIIETNMNHPKVGQDGFKLKNTYSQISVETKASIRYIFMSQSIMSNTFSSAASYKDKSYGINVKTSFAY